MKVLTLMAVAVLSAAALFSLAAPPPAGMFGVTLQQKQPRLTVYSKQELAAHVDKTMPNATARDRYSAVWIMLKESSGNPWIRNRKTTSHGLNGFLKSTWKSVIKNSRGTLRYSLHPPDQIRALFWYCDNRYGSVNNARIFWLKKGWY